ncbi:Hypothetical predicted protein, partial [Paramuricea clavata]
MNCCLRNKYPNGSFSYSASSQFSGITHDATAFVGCDAGKCCACFGPKGGRDHYCSRKCKAVNGGTIVTGEVYVWYWITTRMPERLWKRCMEFKIKTSQGNLKRITLIERPGACSEQFQTFLNEG